MKRTSAGLREYLFDTLEALRDGRMQADEAKAGAMVAVTIIKSVEMEIRYRQELLAAKKEGKTLQLGDVELAPEYSGPPLPKIIRGKNDGASG